jgi:isochorismate pyruvate lyase
MKPIMNKEKPENLEQARARIDEIDSAVVDLLATRQFYVDQALRFKRSGYEIQSPERTDAIIERVRAEAQAKALDPDLVERIYHEVTQHIIRRELKEIRP